MFGNIFNKQKKEEAVTLNEEIKEAPVASFKVNSEVEELLAIIADPSIKGEFISGTYMRNKPKDEAVWRLLKTLILRFGAEWLKCKLKIEVTRHKFTPRGIGFVWGDGQDDVPLEYVQIDIREGYRSVMDITFHSDRQKDYYEDAISVLSDPNVIKMDQEYRKHKVADSNEYKFRLIAEKLSKIVK